MIPVIPVIPVIITAIITSHIAQVILRRSELAVLYENMKPKWHSSFNAPPSPLQGPVQLYHPCVSSTLAGHKLVLRKLKNGNNMPLTYFMGQAGGLFIVEFFWQRLGNAGGTSDTKNDWHVIAGSCAPSLSPSHTHTHTHTHPTLRWILAPR